MKKKLLSMLLSAALLLGAVSLPASASSADRFTDVRPTDWYYEAVDYAVSNGLFNGTGETTFSPEQPMTRGMFVTVLGRKAGVDRSLYPGSEFQDVREGQYYTPYVNWAAENGIVNGTGGGRFSPDAAITREQVAKILYGYAQKTGNNTSLSSERFDGFVDKGNASHYAVESLQWATTHLILQGTDDGYLIPGSKASRAQVAKIFLSASPILVNNELTDDPKPTEERITLTDEQGNPTLSIPIPASWKDRYTATARGDGLGVTFYSTRNLYSGHGGMLFQLTPYKSPSDYSYIPSTTLLKRLEKNGTVYDLVCRKPTDVQFDMEYQEEYLQMQADIPQMLEGIESFLPEA